jgi:hypothetical protein
MENLTSLEQLVRDENINSLFYYSLCFFLGIGTPKNSSKAFFLFRLLFQLNHQMAHYLIGLFFFERSEFRISLSAEIFSHLILVPTSFHHEIHLSFSKAISFLLHPTKEDLNKNKEQVSQNHIIQIVYTNFLIPIQFEESYESNTHQNQVFLEAVDLKQNHFIELTNMIRMNPYDLKLILELGNCYFEGSGTSVNLKKSEELFMQAHIRKNDEGTFGLLKCLEKRKAFPSML